MNQPQTDTQSDSQSGPLLFLKGVAMGIAEVIPGVSGGTIAFITGIYRTLIESIKSVNFKALSVLRAEGVKACWHHVNGTFLVILFSGMGVSILTLARVVKYLLEHHEILIWSFFFGLIAASVLFVAGQIRIWKLPAFLSIASGITVALFISGMTPAQATATPLNIFLSGCIAICAWVLPGISGSFILLLLGMYGHIMDAIKDFSLSTIGIFGAGCCVGIMIFSRLLSWLYAQHKDITLAFLTGFMAGSLYIVWPWKQIENRVITQRLMPWTFEQATGNPPQTGSAVIVVGIGLITVLLLEKISEKKQSLG